MKKFTVFVISTCCYITLAQELGLVYICFPAESYTQIVFPRRIAKVLQVQPITSSPVLVHKTSPLFPYIKTATPRFIATPIVLFCSVCLLLTLCIMEKGIYKRDWDIGGRQYPYILPNIRKLSFLESIYVLLWFSIKVVKTYFPLCIRLRRLSSKLTWM